MLRSRRGTWVLKLAAVHICQSGDTVSCNLKPQPSRETCGGSLRRRGGDNLVHFHTSVPIRSGLVLHFFAYLYGSKLLWGIRLEQDDCFLL